MDKQRRLISFKELSEILGTSDFDVIKNHLFNDSQYARKVGVARQWVNYLKNSGELLCYEMQGRQYIVDCEKNRERAKRKE